MNAPNVTDKDPTFVERQIPRGEHQIYVRDYAGTEPAFVLMHGFPDNLGIYDRLAPLLAEAGHKRRAIEYLLGNHAIAETIYRHDPAVAQYVPYFGVDQWAGHNVFFRDGERVCRTYFINNRGGEAMGTIWSYLDITPLGRQETWEDSPEGYPQTAPYKWWNWHDNYDAEALPDPKWIDVLTDPYEAAKKRAAEEKKGCNYS